MHRFVYAVLVVASVPLVSHASVILSEVAWMGTADNANAEWIELYNNGPKQDVTGWSLSAVDGKPAITLSGSIPAKKYVLLERTSDNTVPSIEAFLVYTGGLGNAGEILELRDAEGSLVDSIDGNNAWAIGGNNDTKETVQRSGEPAVEGYVTASATPGRGGARPPQPPPSTPSRNEIPVVKNFEVSKPAPKPTQEPEQPKSVSASESSTSSVRATSTNQSAAIAYAFGDSENGDGHENPLWWYVLGLTAAILVTIVIVLLVRREQGPEIIAGFEIESDE